jgi:putative FmdB family regulatory protein
VPLYDFACQACGHAFETLVPAGETPACEACGALDVERLYSPISPPARLGLRGGAARDDQARRSEREAGKREAFKAERAKRRQS